MKLIALMGYLAIGALTLFNLPHANSKKVKNTMDSKNKNRSENPIFAAGIAAASKSKPKSRSDNPIFAAGIAAASKNKPKSRSENPIFAAGIAAASKNKHKK